MVAHDSLVARHDDVIDEGALPMQRYLVARGLIDPAQRELLIIDPILTPRLVARRLANCGRWGLLRGLRVQECVPEDGFFGFELV